MVLLIYITVFQCYKYAHFFRLRRKLARLSTVGQSRGQSHQGQLQPPLQPGPYTSSLHHTLTTRGQLLPQQLPPPEQQLEGTHQSSHLSTLPRTTLSARPPSTTTATANPSSTTNTSSYLNYENCDYNQLGSPKRGRPSW